MIEDNMFIVIGIFGGLLGGSYVVLNFIAHYLRDIRTELRRIAWKKQ